ncbi:hypothetical protein LLG90_19155 [Aromatoleum toluclasticum]|uniref:hypothetical protein n=1 Tax=Aromatoleum toluclasticum TaxID=92003 RepID=UPI001D196191|nr:hypothetical protein [Aromatoleum toluclasticum]MCC4117478.1 hypothetical protein [Aromatoleum toluclasticum]
MRRRFLLGAVLALLGAGGGAQAQEQMIYLGCTDAQGRAVAAVSDPALERVVASRAGAAPEIRYNEAILPRLTPESRLFLFAHECARHNLGLPLGGGRTEAEARRADCHGLETLSRSGLLDAARIDALERELQFSAEEWERVPGPPRTFALRACATQSAVEHLLTRPKRAKPEWNACIRGCGARLWVCAPHNVACEDAYERCVSLCDFRSPP